MAKILLFWRLYFIRRYLVYTGFSCWRMFGCVFLATGLLFRILAPVSIMAQPIKTHNREF